MAVYKRGAKWHFTKTIDGVRYRQALKTARTKTQAEEAEIKILNQIHEGAYGRPTANKTFKEYVEKTFIPWTKENKRSYRSDLSRLKPLIAFFGRKLFKEISQLLVESYKSKRLKMPVVFLNKKGKITKQRERSKAAVNRELQLLSRIFTLAIEKKEARENPVSLVDLLPGERKRRRRLHPEERQKLLEAIRANGSQDKRLHLLPIITLDLNSGLRRTELLSLKVTDVDFIRNVMRATETKNGEEREVEMNATARALLIDLVSQARTQGWEYIFTNPRTGTRYKDIKKAFNNALRDAGIEDLRFHDLRHTFASQAGDDPGVSVAALAETMGHKDWKTTMQYTHASKKSKLRVVEAQERREVENAGHNSVTDDERQAS
jgi:integrase